MLGLSVSKFVPGSKVRISDKHHSFPGVTGIVAMPPDHILQLVNDDSWSAHTRTVQGAQKEIKFHWVIFDGAHDDGSGDGPYHEAEIEIDFLTAL
jgi:hypothetical protein